MNAKHIPHRRFALTLVAILAAAAVVSLTVADAPIWSIANSSPTTYGNAVSMSLTNAGATSFTGYAAVNAVVNDAPIWSFAPVALAPGQTAKVTVGFPGPVQSVLKVGVTSSPNAF